MAMNRPYENFWRRKFGFQAAISIGRRSGSAMRTTILFLSITILLEGFVLSSCRNDERTNLPSDRASQVENTTNAAEHIEAISSETLAEYKAKHNASVAVIDMLIPQQALVLGDESIVKILVLNGITNETVVPRDSIARIEKTEIPGAGMVTVKIVDKTGKEISFTLTPEDAAKVSE